MSLNRFFTWGLRRVALLASGAILIACNSGQPTPLPQLEPTRTALPAGAARPTNPPTKAAETPLAVATAQPISPDAIQASNADQLKLLATRDENAPSRLYAVSSDRILGLTLRSFELIDPTTLTSTRSVPFQLTNPDGSNLYWYAASSDARVGATMEADGSATVYDLEGDGDNLPLTLAKPLSTSKSDIALSPDGKELIYVNGTVQRYTVATGKPVGRAQSIPEDTLQILFSEDGSHLGTVQPDGQVTIFDTRVTRRATQPLTLNTGFTEVQSLFFSPAGNFVGVGDGRNKLSVWDLSAKALDKPTRQFEIDGQTIPVFDNTADKIALLNAKGAVIYNLADGSREQELALSAGIQPTAAHFDPTGNTLFISSLSALESFRVSDGERLQSSRRAPVTHVIFTPDSKRLISWGTWNLSTEIAIWEADATKPVARLPHNAAVRWVVLGPAQKYLASITFENTIHVWKIADGGEALTLAAQANDDRRALLCLTGDDSAVVYLEPGAMFVRPIERGQAKSYPIPDNTRSYTTCQNQTQSVAFAEQDEIQVMDTNGKKLKTIALPEDAPELRDSIVMAFSPDGQQLAAISEKELFVWSVQDGALVARVALARRALFGMQFSPDGKRISVNYGDGADIIEIATQKAVSLAIPTAPQSRWVNLVFGGNGDIVIAASRLSTTESHDKPIGERDYTDGEISIYDAGTGKLINGLEKAGLIYTLAISADGTRLATGTQSDQLSVWGTK